jgi:hypothetical protein
MCVAGAVALPALSLFTSPATAEDIHERRESTLTAYALRDDLIDTTVFGELRASGGLPVPGVDVRVTSSDGTVEMVTTDDHGHWQLAVHAERTTSFEASWVGDAAHLPTNSLIETVRPLNSGLTMAVTGPDVAAPGGPVPLSVTVADASGPRTQEQVAIKVTCLDSGEVLDYSLRATTDAHGVASLVHTPTRCQNVAYDVFRDRHVVHVTWHPLLLDVDVPTDTDPWTSVPIAATLTEGGAPVAGVAVEVEVVRECPWWPPETCSRDLGTFYTDPDGRIAVEAEPLPRGSHVVAVRVAGDATTTPLVRYSEIDVSGPTSTISLSSTSARVLAGSPITIHGRLTDEDGAALPAARIRVRRSGIWVTDVTTDSAGAFSFTDPAYTEPVRDAQVRDQTYEVEYAGTPTRTGSTATFVARSLLRATSLEMTRPFTVYTGDPVTFVGDLTWDSDRTLEGARLDVVRIEGGFREVELGQVEVAADGTFSFTDVPRQAGRTAYRFSRPSDSHVETLDREFEVDVDRAVTEIELSGPPPDWVRGSLALSGRVTVADGRDMVGQTVQLAQLCQSAPDLRWETVAQAGGVFELMTHVPAGARCDLYASVEQTDRYLASATYVPVESSPWQTTIHVDPVMPPAGDVPLVMTGLVESASPEAMTGYVSLHERPDQLTPVSWAQVVDGRFRLELEDPDPTVRTYYISYSNPWEYAWTRVSVTVPLPELTVRAAHQRKVDGSYELKAGDHVTWVARVRPSVPSGSCVVFEVSRRRPGADRWSRARRSDCTTTVVDGRASIVVPNGRRGSRLRLRAVLAEYEPPVASPWLRATVR